MHSSGPPRPTQRNEVSGLGVVTSHPAHHVAARLDNCPGDLRGKLLPRLHPDDGLADLAQRGVETGESLYIALTRLALGDVVDDPGEAPFPVIGVHPVAAGDPDPADLFIRTPYAAFEAEVALHLDPVLDGRAGSLPVFGQNVRDEDLEGPRCRGIFITEDAGVLRRAESGMRTQIQVPSANLADLESEPHTLLALFQPLGSLADDAEAPGQPPAEHDRGHTHEEPVLGAFEYRLEQMGLDQAVEEPAGEQYPQRTDERVDRRYLQRGGPSRCGLAIPLHRTPRHLLGWM